MDGARGGHVLLVVYLCSITFTLKLTSALLMASRFKLLLGSPNGAESGEGDSESLIRTKAYERGVLALPGTVFLPNGGKTAYVRASFSLLTEGDVEKAVKRLREVILEVRQALT